MNIDRKVVEQALEALNKSQPIDSSSVIPHNAHCKALSALREALAEQPEQQTIHCKHRRENNGVCPHHNLHCGWPKCNEPEQPAQQEPVAWVNQANLNSAAIQRNRGGQGDTHTWSETPTWDHSVLLYTSPPAQRTWVGLTDEERFLDECRSAEEIEYARAVEAKLKEKNT